MRRPLAALLGAALLLGGMTSASAAVSLPAVDLDDPWLASASDATTLALALDVHAAKLPVEFHDRLAYVLDDGTLRVMAAMPARDADAEAFVAANTTALQWYGGAPRFLATVTPDQLTALLTSSYVRFVEPDYPLSWMTSDSTTDISARSIDQAGTGVWSFDAAAGDHGAFVSELPALSVDEATGKGVVVAVNDGGIDRTHKDFSGEGCEPAPYQPCESRIVEATTVSTVVDLGYEPGGDLPTTDYASGHGTHVAGTIAGNGFYTRDGDVDVARYGGDGHVFGVAPQSSIVSVKNGDGPWAGLGTGALQWTVDNAERLGIKVSSNSWGCLGGCSFDPNSATAAVLEDLYDAGVLVTFAAGNDDGGPDGAAFSGNAQSPYVLGVAAYDDAIDSLADFSSRGRSGEPMPTATTVDPDVEPRAGYRRPDIAAPGVAIWAARTLSAGYASGTPRANTNDVLGGGSSGFVPYASMGGTSMATPHVSGAAAVLFSACPNAEVRDVMRALVSTADGDRITTTGGGRLAEPWEVGYGALDVRGAVDWILGLAVCGGTGNLAPTAALSGPERLGVDELGTFDGSASVDTDGGIAAFAWDLGDGTTATTPVVEHAWDVAGTYTLTLRVTDTLGAEDVATLVVTVGDPIADGVTIVGPADDATLDPGTHTITGTVGRPSGGGGTLFLVGDGTSGMGLGDDASAFALSSAGNGGMLTDYTTTSVANDPDAWDAAGTPTFVGGEAVALSGDPITLEVEVDYPFPMNGVALNCPLDAALFSSTGQLLAVADAAVPSTVPGETVVAAFEFTPPVGLHAGLGVQFGSSYIDCGSFSPRWIWGDDTVAGTLTLAPADTLMTVVGGADVERVQLAVDGTETVTVPVDTAIGDREARWSTDLDLAEGPHTITATWLEADGTTVDSDSVRVTVASPNTAPVAVATGPEAVTRGVSATFDGSASSDADGDELSFRWDFGDGSLLATGSVVEHTWDADGSYVVTLEVSDGRGGVETTTLDVVVTDDTPDGPAKGQRRVFADLDTGECGSQWRLVLTGVAGTGVPDVAWATWSDGATTSIDLSSHRATVAYYSAADRGATLESVFVDVKKNWKGDFFLVDAVC